MKTSHKPGNKFDGLRRQAEDLIRKNEQTAVHAPGDILGLIHELQIHQVELEIQNEELKRAQQELSDLYHQYERLYEFAPCGYVTLNSQGVITRVNINAVNLLGTSKRHLLESAFSRYLPSAWKDAFLEARRNAGQTGEKEQFEMQLKRKDGPPLWVRANILADRDESQAVVQWRMVLVDISREKEAETQIRKLNQTLERRVAERTAELEQRSDQLQQMALALTLAEDRERKHLASILHDDFQQQAAYVKIKLHGMVRQADTAMRQQLKELVKYTDDCIEKMRSLAHALNPPALHLNGLSAALKMLAKDMRKHHGLTVTLNLQARAEPTSPTLASILYRSVRELLINVVKHAGVNTAAVDMRCQNKRIRIQVADQGKGFDYPAVRAGQGDESGFGLYNIGDRMMFLGGTMQVNTAPGKGSCIVLTVPAREASPPLHSDALARTAAKKSSRTPPPARTATKSDDEKPIRILIVEDHQLIRKGLVELLQGHGDLAVVGEATNGGKAIELATRLRPHVVLMDVSMPEMDGVEATARIIRNHPDIRIIGLSMFNDNETRQKMLDAGARAFLAKTDSPDKLIKTIRRVCAVLRE